jgi:tetratricopeptide (TPR) repeat protein
VRTIFILFTFLLVIGFSCAEAQCEPKAIKAYGDVSKTIDDAIEKGKNGDYEKQLELCLKAVDQTRKIQDKHNCFWPNAHLALSDVYYNTGDLEKALLSASEALGFCKQFEMDNCDCMSKAQMKMAMAYEDMDEDSLAKNIYLQALELCEVDGTGFKEAFLLLGLGDLARKSGDYEEALSKYNQAENIVRRVSSSVDESQRILARCNFSRGFVLFKQGDCEQSKDKLRIAMSAAETAHDQKTIARCNYLLGRILQNDSEYKEALDYYSKAISISSRMKYNIILVDACNGKGDVFTIQGAQDSSAFYTSNSYTLAKEVNYKDGMCDALNIDSKNLRVLFKVDSIEHVDGLFQAQTAFAYANSVNNKFGLVDAYNNYALYFLKIKDYPEARKYARFAFEIAFEIGYTAGEADALNYLGDICYKLEYNKDSALYYFQKSLQRSKSGYFKECGNYKVGQVNSYNHIGDIYKKMGKKTLAGEYYTQAYIISQEIMFDKGLEKAKKSLKLKKSGIPPKDPAINEEKSNVKEK